MLVAVFLVLAACREPAEIPEPAPADPAEAPAEPAPAEEPAPVAIPATPPSEDPAPVALPADPAAATGLADGASCLASAECASGLCEGQGCGADAPGVCMSKMRPCTRDRRPYCGCDGVTFYGSGSCPGQRFASKGTCEAPEK